MATKTIYAQVDVSHATASAASIASLVEPLTSTLLAVLIQAAATKEFRMDWHIRPAVDGDFPDLLRLSVAAWAPIFDSFLRILGPAIYAANWPDWRASQSAVVERVCRNPETRVLVAEAEGRAVGFLAYRLHVEDRLGEVQLLAVDPDYQNAGIGTELNNAALDEMRDAGMQMARVETGGDPAHAPARRAYEKAGYTGLPIVRYFQHL